MIHSMMATSFEIITKQAKISLAVNPCDKGYLTDVLLSTAGTGWLFLLKLSFNRDVNFPSSWILRKIFVKGW